MRLAYQHKPAVADISTGVKARTTVRRLQIYCWVALIAIAVVRAWFTRYQLNADSISYLDIGRMIAEGNLGAAVNAYWSPGYPVLHSVFLWLFRPNVYWEFPLAHFANVLTFVAALASFQWFWSEVRLWHKNHAGDSGAVISDYTFWALGYTVFAVATLSVVTVEVVNPDLLVETFCILAGWSVLRFRRIPTAVQAVLLGVVLALGYYAKAPFFPIGFVFILCACFEWPMSRRMVLLGGTALTTFLLFCAPFIAALSLAKARLTFGDSARLNYAWFIDAIHGSQHWQGGPPGAGMPIHPTHKLNDYPEIYEFAARNMGTYPPWFDPTYWYEGVTPHPNWKVQPKAFVVNAVGELQIIMEFGAQLVCAAVILILLTNHCRRWTKSFSQLWFMWLPGAVALLMLALVHVETRFFGGWLILLFAGAICACSLPVDSGTRRVVECVGLAVLITTGAAMALQASQEAIGLDHAPGRSSRDAAIAVFLLNNGLHPGDQVAVIGHGPGAYWAHLARLQVVAEIPESNVSRSAFDFWESGSEIQQRALGILERTGAKAVIAADPALTPYFAPPPYLVPPPWKEIGGSRAYVYFFPSRQATNANALGPIETGRPIRISKEKHW